MNFNNYDEKKNEIFLYFIPMKQPEVVKRDIRFARQLRIASKVKVTQINMKDVC